MGKTGSGGYGDYLASKGKLEELINGILGVASECNCRASHGAEGAEHLLHIEKLLRGVIEKYKERI